MKQALIVAHPRLNSFTMAMAEAYAEAARHEGVAVVLRDLYRLGFDPLLHMEELPDHEGFQPRADVMDERSAVGDADVFAFFYPLWFNAPPAMLKGYVDRVFGMGFGYSRYGLEGNQPLLSDRKLVSFTSSGAPQVWVESSGAWDAMRKHFDDHLAAVTGLALIGHHNIGEVVPGMREEVVAGHARTVAEAAARIAHGGR
ncbi:MAG: NAD(P)H-dependent oxidoreductase [Brevundimonas sp.]|jgi:NAD(P)H dehydrogenase (quinone)|uniref:NAD(P)H-dependent oxidoreductase n=1 Tax=Brevundimonas sp. TaxID=1871086 RepID=UPI0025B99AF7|nr:NAD(P)H-dependent oxidoreductase [Brevundimonas sp.]MCH4267271.1 NAD(P)H-dependent oxidoreductase [Brevundimonas sp.]